MKNLLITGATSGIGKEAAFYLSKNEYSVYLTGRNRDVLSEEAREIENCIGIYGLDLANPDDIQGMFDDIKDRGIMLDGFIHCAGLEGGLSPVRSAKAAVLDTLMRVHYLSFVEMCRQFYKRSVSNEGAVIIALSSLAAIMCQKNSVDYSSSKAAMNAAIKVMAKEFLKRSIRVNGILPANVDTPMSKNLKAGYYFIL